MTISPIKALSVLLALLPASLGAAVLAILLDVARNANDRAERAEHRESERRGERDEARSALAESERERGVLQRLLARSEGAVQTIADTQEMLKASHAEVRRLKSDAAREDEQNTADRAAVERLTVDNDGLRGDLKRAERSGLRAAFQMLDVRRDLDAVYAIGWQAIVERDEWRRRGDKLGLERNGLRGDLKEAWAERKLAIARAEAAEKARAALAVELEAMRPDAEAWRRQVASSEFLDDGQAPVHWSANDGCDYPCGLTVDTIGIGTWSANRERTTCPGCVAVPVEPVAAAPVEEPTASEATEREGGT